MLPLHLSSSGSYTRVELRALQGSKAETRELLGGTEDNNFSPTQGLIDLPSRLIIYKKETEKIELVLRPDPFLYILPFPHSF